MATPRVLRKFPLSLNIGTDICHIPRIRRILAPPAIGGPSFVRKILNADERSHPSIQWLCESQGTVTPGPNAKQISEEETSTESKAHTRKFEWGSPNQISLAAQFLAGRFAAKEAVKKAHPQRGLTWHTITIQTQVESHQARTGAPVAIIKGRGEDYEAPVSISHDGDYATAVCLGAVWPHGSSGRSSDDARDENHETLTSISHDGDGVTAVSGGTESSS